MKEIKEIENKKVAVLMISEEEEYIWFSGKAKYKEDKIIIERDKKSLDFVVPQSAYERIRKCEGELKEVFEGCDYLITLYVGSLPDDADLSQYQDTGLKWLNKT
jgi:hypothetical protein